MGLIDMRVRPPLPSLLKTLLFKKGGIQQASHPDFPRPPSADAGSVDMLLQEMDAVDMQWAVVMGRYSLEPYGIVPNDEIASFVAKFPDRFVAFAGLDLRLEPDGWITEIRRCMRMPCFKGVCIEPTISLDPTLRLASDKRLYPIYEECVQLDVPITITLGGVLQRMAKQPYELSSPIQIYQVAVDFPNLDIHIAHAAYPWVMETIGIVLTCPNVWLSPDLYMVKQMPGAAEYAKAADNYCSDRTVFGSNYPSKPFPQMIAAYREWGWRPGVIERIFQHNALRLLRMH